MIDKSVEKLRADSVEHLGYEIWMMQETTQRLLHDNALHTDAVLKNAMVESCVVHARSLAGFIFLDNARTDDITADDYVTDKLTWKTARGSIPPILVTVNIRTAKEIAHLTTKRLDADDPAKLWPLVEITEALHVLLKRFADHAATDRLDPSVARFIKGLQPPMASTAISHYNPLSTEIATAAKPLRPGADVGTVSPIKPWADAGGVQGV